jgi:cell shape-determining protein MreC
MANLTASDDVKKGDVLLTSGIGGVFPPGIPVGIVTAFQQDPAMTFLSAQVMPLARPTYGRYLLLLDTYSSQTTIEPKTKLNPSGLPEKNPEEKQFSASLENAKPAPFPPSKANGEPIKPGDPTVDKREVKP